MDILDIAIAKQLAGGGGGSGTDNYNDLSNLPKINDVTLSGNKTSANLGLQSEINSDSKLASDLIDDTNQDNKFVTSTEKNTWNAKQNAIDADHKLNADYVDDSTSTNKFVTASDKEAWNAKQNAIDNSHKLSSDLVDDANRTNKFVTSTEKNTWNGKQNAIDSEHKLSSSLVSFTTAEAAALASGIDSAKVAQISTNQSNILYVSDHIGKNYYNIKNENSVFANTDTVTIQSGTKSVTATVNADGSVTLTGATEGTTPTFILESGDLSRYAGMYLSGAYSDKVFIQMEQRSAPYDIYAKDTGSGAQIASSMPTQCNFFIRLSSNFTIPGSITLKPMICSQEQYNISPTYQPYALPNYDLTRLEAEDRAALAEDIDAGAKNKVDIASVTTTGSNYVFNQLVINALPAGSYVFSYSSTQSDSGDIELVVMNDSATLASVTITSKSGSNAIEFTINGTATKLTLYSVRAGTYSNFMICTKAAFGVSNKFVPYRPNYDLVCSSVPTLKRIAYWTSTFTIPIKPFAESTGSYMYKIYVNGGNPGELGVYLITGSLVTDIKAHSKVSYTINGGTSVVFTATSTVVAYYELIKLPST